MEDGLLLNAVIGKIIQQIRGVVVSGVLSPVVIS